MDDKWCSRGRMSLAVCSGTVPEEMGKLAALRSLDLDGNKLTGEGSAKWMHLVTVEIIAYVMYVKAGYLFSGRVFPKPSGLTRSSPKFRCTRSVPVFVWSVATSFPCP